MHVKIDRYDYDTSPGDNEPIDLSTYANAIVLEATVVGDDGISLEPEGFEFQWFLDGAPIDAREDCPQQCIIDRATGSNGQYSCEATEI